MATWTKENVRYPLIKADGSADTDAHTVLLRPTDGSSDVACSHIGNGYYQPDSDLDDEQHYYWYVDAVEKKILLPLRARTLVYDNLLADI